MKKTIRITAAFLMLIATLGSCVKGDKGDMGVSGTNGTNGTNGAAGTNGTNGTNGNANVQAGLATIVAANWGWNATSQANWVDISDAQITAAIVASGTVSVFITTSASQADWTALPLTIWGTPSISYNYNYYLNYVEITSQNTNLTSSTFNTIYVKIVAITSAQRKANPKTNWKNYNEVMTALNSNTTTTSTN